MHLAATLGTLVRFQHGTPLLVFPKEVMLIGSKAAKHWFPEFREPHDTDYISEEEIDNTDSKFCPSFAKVIEKYPNDSIANPQVLYTLKVSHAFWDIHWEKTMADIRFFQSKKITLDEELFTHLYHDCELRYGKKQAYLNKSNDDFFKDGVTRKYVHDDIHAAMAFYDRPLYHRIKKDQDKALTSGDLFLQLSHEDKIKLCQEEIYVTALERFIIPANFERLTPFKSYLDACKLLITSMTKGWFPKFIVENWIDISTNNRYDYVRKFKQALETKKVNDYKRT